MRFHELIKQIAQESAVKEKPIVLVDIGASGDIVKKWNSIASSSICIAFDADERDFQVSQVADSGYLKLLKINRIVLPQMHKNESDFYLTESPYCSSTLEPDEPSLDPWLFSPLFKVKKKMQLPATTLNTVLKDLDIDYIDWFKTDSQGIDASLYTSIDEKIRINILAVDFEPGLMDAYLGEDKVATVLDLLNSERFWISSFKIGGSKRIHRSLEIHSKYLRTSPCWAEISALRGPHNMSYRSALLLVIFSLIEEQWGYALEICRLYSGTHSNLRNIERSIRQVIKKESEFNTSKAKHILVRLKKKLISFLS